MEFLRADCTSEFSRGQDPIETSPMFASFFELLLVWAASCCEKPNRRELSGALINQRR
jgi:hypothetical protein